MIQLIPLPKKVSQLTGTFRLTQDTSCYFAPELQETFHFLRISLKKPPAFPSKRAMKWPTSASYMTLVSRKKAISSTARKAASRFSPPHPPAHFTPSKPYANF